MHLKGIICIYNWTCNIFIWDGYLCKLFYKTLIIWRKLSVPKLGFLIFSKCLKLYSSSGLCLIKS